MFEVYSLLFQLIDFGLKDFFLYSRLADFGYYYDPISECNHVVQSIGS